MHDLAVRPPAAGDPAALPEDLAGLLSSGAYPHPAPEVRCLQTHMSWVLLAGDYAYKIKRPVRYPFADFRDPAVRERLCREELRLNARFAPALYLSVEPVCLREGRAVIGGPGEPVEWAVRMRRFDRALELDRLVLAGAVEPGELRTFGAALAARHEGLPIDEQTAACEVVERTGRTLQANLREARACLDAVGVQLPAAFAGVLDRRFIASIGQLSQRALAGRVRECHGDLHLSNIVRLGGELVAFDCLEFDPALRWLDVADEVAFLWADLRGYGRPELGDAFLQGYLDASGDLDLVEVLDLFAAHRALVRAKVLAIRAAEQAPGSDVRSELVQRCRRYLDVAVEALAPRSAQLILVSGVSGSGKTWLAQRLAPALGALHLRSDLERKRLGGLAPLANSGSPLGGGLYSAELGARTYERLLRGAAHALAGGHAVLVDATFLARAQREPFLRLAAERGVACRRIECVAPDAELRARIARRRAAGEDASEADLAVLDRQLARREEPVDPGDRPVATIDTSGEDPLRAALQALLSGSDSGRSAPPRSPSP